MSIIDDVGTMANRYGFRVVGHGDVQEEKESYITHPFLRLAFRYQEVIVLTGSISVLVFLVSLMMLVVIGVISGSDNFVFTWLQSWHAGYWFGLALLLSIVFFVSFLHIYSKLPKWELEYGEPWQIKHQANFRRLLRVKKVLYKLFGYQTINIGWEHDGHNFLLLISSAENDEDRIYLV